AGGRGLSQRASGEIQSAGQSDRVDLYLNKELEAFPRKSEIRLPSMSEEKEEVRVYVEQAPAQGRARVLLESRILQAPITVNWDNAEEQAVDWQSLIESLQPKPTIPNRMVLP